MPELPEVETVKNGLVELLGVGTRRSPKIVKAVRRRKNIREAIPKQIEKEVVDQKIISLKRRAKYLIFEFRDGFLLNHLGMTGSWRLCKEDDLKKHDHFLLYFQNGKILAYNDPRRFGVVTWSSNIENHQKMVELGPEPLSDEFNASDFWESSKNSKSSIKAFLMNQKNVVGVGNIYASEALFRAGVRPQRKSHLVSKVEIARVVQESKNVLQEAIKAGGSTISDFKQAGGESGYFQNHFSVYGRKGQGCYVCGTVIKEVKLTGRSSFYCPKCQKR